MIVILVGSIVLSVALVWVARGLRLHRPWARPAALAFYALLFSGMVAGTLVLLSDDDGHGDMFTALIGAVGVLAIIVGAATAVLRRRPE
jgi:hypothetical protein